MTEESNLAKQLNEKNKFSDEELKKVKNIQNNYINIQNQFGQLRIAVLGLEQQEVDLEENLKSLQEEEKKFLDGITKKYGEGTLDPKTGTFTPNKS
tara:strand:- start:31 stop:318 length:288 start_codon:yes stop_codon:yes gene_type:complete